MSAFLGGSAYAMANQIAEGYILVTAQTMKKLKPADVKALDAELEKLLREIRGDVTPIEDHQAVQKKNRRLGRINQAKLIMRNAPR